MGHKTSLPLFLGLVFSSITFASPKDLGRTATGYLGTLDDVRSSTFRLEEAKARHAVAIDTEKRDIELHKMYERLYHQHAISEEEYRRSILRRDLAIARKKESADLIELARANYEVNQQHVSLSLGKELTVEAVHAGYVRVWKAECEVYKSAYDATGAEVQLHAFLYDMVRRLYQKQAVSYEEYLKTEYAYLEAKERHQKNAVVGEICPKGIPTLEEVKKLLTPPGP